MIDIEETVNKDVKTLKENVLALNNRTDDEIEELYRKYSNYCYSAGWLILSPEVIKGFSMWFDRMKELFRP